MILFFDYLQWPKLIEPVIKTTQSKFGRIPEQIIQTADWAWLFVTIREFFQTQQGFYEHVQT